MKEKEISFENLPRAVALISDQISELKLIVSSNQQQVIQKSKVPIDINKACKLIGRAKPTVYRLVRTRQIPHCKKGKDLYFYEDELLEWIEKGRRRTIQDVELEAIRNFKKK